MTKSHSIKKDFIVIVIFSSFFPFLISLVFLSLVLKNSFEKTEQVNSQIQHTQELEILDSLHKSMGLVHEATNSVEMNEYFLANSETEVNYRNKLKLYLSTLQEQSPFENTSWIIFGGRGNVILSTSELLQNFEYDKNKMNGASFYESTQEIILSLPLFYNSNNSLEKYKKTYAYVGLKIPLSTIKNKYKNLVQIKNISQDLSALKFKAEFNLPNQNKTFFYLFYFYIFIFFIFNLFAVYFGIKMLQNKIIQKLNLLTVRVSNDIMSFSKLKLEDINVDHLTKNEIDSLSLIFNKYMKYVGFLQYEIEKSSQLAAVGNIAHTIAHDLRKPFSQTSLFVEQIEKVCSQEEAVSLAHEYKPLLKNSIVYVEHLLQEIMEAGVSRLNLSKLVKLEEIISKSISNSAFFQKNCEVNIEYDIQLSHYLKVDELRIVRIFSNIITNALEAMNFKGKIWFHVMEDIINKNCEIIIGNNNSTISPLDIKNLFEPFFTKNKKNGTGLGLSIAQKIIQLHEGKISCRSLEETGVEFILQLPLAEEGYHFNISNCPQSLIALQTFPEKMPNSSPQTNKIIIVDDDPFINKIWKRSVKDAFVISFYKPEECLNKINQNELFLDSNTIVISDFNFGSQSNLDFYEFILKIRAFFNGPIFLTTDALDEDLDFNFLKNHSVIKINKSVYSFEELQERGLQLALNSEQPKIK